MNSKSKKKSKDEILSNILNSFDTVDKQKLAQQLVEEFNLKESEGIFFIHQVEGLLGRKLKENERFKLHVLQTIIGFHGIASGRLSGDATTEPPPPISRKKR